MSKPDDHDLVLVNVTLTGPIMLQWPINGQPIPYKHALEKFRDWALNGITVTMGPYNTGWYPPHRIMYAVTVPQYEGEEDDKSGDVGQS